MRYRRVIRPDQMVELPQRTFDLLMLFLREPDVLHSRPDLFQRVWPGVIVEDANLSQAVWVLRKALGPERKDWIRTVAKGGYVFAPPAAISAIAAAEVSDTAGPVAATPDPATRGATTSVAPAPTAPTPVAPTSLAPTPAAPTSNATGAGAAPTAEPDDAAPAQTAPPPSTPPADGITGPALKPAPAPTAHRRAWVAMVALCLVSLVAAASWFGNLRSKPADAATNILLVEVQGPTAGDPDDHWRTTVLHAWLDWKLRLLPDVNVLREENLAAESSPTRPRVVLLATGASPDRTGEIYVRASFDGPAGTQSVQRKGPAADLSRMVDEVSRQVMQRLLPARMDDTWPTFELDPASARRFAETFKAVERRDWTTARSAAQDVIQRSPRFAVARLQLAIALGRLGQAAMAIEQFATAHTTLKPLPEDAGKVIDALQLTADPRRQVEAAEAWGALARTYPERRGFLLDQAKLLARVGELDQARRILEQDDWPRQALSLRIPQLLALADLHLQLGDPQQARLHAKEAQALTRSAGNDWRIEHAMALAFEAEANVAQYEGKADLAPFEQAAVEFERAGDEIDALYTRFLAASAQPPSAATTAHLEALLAKARASGFRRLEIDILRRAAFQHYIAGNIPEYRARLSQALTVANAAGDTNAQQHLDLDLLNEDMTAGDFAGAEQRLQRLRTSGLRGERALWVGQFAAQLEFIRGNYDGALATLDRAVAALRAEQSPLPPIAKARVACGKADVMLVQGHIARARELFATCGKVDHSITRLLADLGTAMVDASVNPTGGDPEALQAILNRINALPDGPDRWWPAISVAIAFTRNGQPAQAEAIYQAIATSATHADYPQLTRLMEVGRAEVAAARGDWATSRRHADRARANVPPDDWAVSNRLTELDIGHNLAQGNTEVALRQLARLDVRAHEVGDAVVLQEVHSLMPPTAVVGECSAVTRAALAERTGLHGATLAWMAPRVDRARDDIKLVQAAPAH